MIDNLLRDLRYALRALARAPGFTLTVVLTLALGIGATTAMFSVVNGVVIKPLPYPESEAVVTVTHSVVFGNVRGSGFPFSPQMLETYATNGQAFQELGLYSGGRATITGIGDPEQVSTLLVTEGTLRALDVQPALGRWFSHDDDQPGVPETVILSHGYWQRQLGGDPGVIGRVMTIDTRLHEVIGVMPAHFALRGFPVDLILPTRINLAQPPNDFRYAALARLKPGINVTQANADIARMLPIYLGKYAPGGGMDALQLQPAVRLLKEDVVGNVGQVLWVLLGSISILLLIACANVANLLLVRAEGRGQELAVRTALGAGRGHIARALMVESLTLSLLGGLLGLALAYGGLRVLVAFGPANLPRLNEITIDLPVLFFTVSISVLSGLLFGLFPMLKLVGRRFASNLAEFVHGGGRWASTGKHQHRTQSTLVVVQVALALVLLIGSGLMIRTFQNLRQVDPGFTDPATIQTLRLIWPGAMRTEAERVVLMQAEILQRLAAIPGVAAAGYIDALPAEGTSNAIVAVEDKTYGTNELPPTRRIKVISPGFLRTQGTPLLAGRDFEWVEVYNQRNVAMVSESFARQEWDTVAGAIGKRIRIGTIGPFQEVIGVVADVYDNGPAQEAPASVYWPAREHPFVAGNLVPLSVAFALRTDRIGTESLIREIRQVVSEVVPDLPLTRVLTLEEVYAASLAGTSFSLVLLGIAGAMALLLSIVGVYGVLAYAVMQHRREVGIRLALGAAPGTVKRMFVYRGMILSGAGIALGAAVAAGLTRLISSLLFGVTPVDAATFLAAAGFLAVAALSASYLPARRASHIDPMRVLREE
jgi:predicted permease